MTAQQPPYYLDPSQEECHFPAVTLALDQPDGLLAVGGNLSAATLLNAYRHGIFPWFSEGQQILWWSPNPRAVIYPERLKISRSLRKRLRQGRFQVTLDRAFDEVIKACATSRERLEPDQVSPWEYAHGTWITPKMQLAYQQLHRLGHAHSIEAWHDGVLVGGLYGIAIGQVFFGESMFSHAADASKVAFAHLVEQLKVWQFSLIDCQVSSQHLTRLGAEEIERSRFIDHINSACQNPNLAPPQWQMSPLLRDSW